MSERIAAAVISEARTRYGLGPAAFDYAISGGDRQAEDELGNAIYVVANRGHEDDLAWTQEERANQLRAALGAELDGYRAKCKARKYTGWSTASRGPIRYAD